MIPFSDGADGRGAAICSRREGRAAGFRLFFVFQGVDAGGQASQPMLRLQNRQLLFEGLSKARLDGA